MTIHNKQYSGYAGDCLLSGACYQQIWAINISVLGQNNLYCPNLEQAQHGRVQE